MTFTTKSILATVCHPERSRSLRVKTSKPRCVAPQGSRNSFPCLYFRNKVTINSKEIPMLRIALRVRLRFRSAQDDTEGEVGGRF